MDRVCTLPTGFRDVLEEFFKGQADELTLSKLG
jgi:hypothetical protein